MVFAPLGFAYQKVWEDFYYGTWSKDKQKYSEVVDKVPGLNVVQDYFLDKRVELYNGQSPQDRYLEDHDLGYEDVVDPRNLSTLGSSWKSAVGTLAWTSDNIKRLYK